MSPIALGAPLGTFAAAAGGEESHFPPAPADFWQPLVSFGTVGNMTLAITRPMVVIVLVFAALSIWLLVSTRKAAVVPGKGQWVTEQVYDFVRNSVARDMIGSKDFLRFTPFLFALFTFILLCNLCGIIPGIQMPPTARVGIPIALTLLVYLVYHWVGIKKQGGLIAYFKWMVPPGIPGWLLPFVFLLELMTYLVTRPLTLALRLFGNMFAGHMLLVVFILGGYELVTAGNVGLALVAIPAWLMGVVMTAFEILIQFLQAFVFTLLAASYIGGALADEH